MNAVAAIAINGFRESRRNRVTVVVFAFALVLIFSATVALEMTVATFDRVMTDLGLGVLSLIATFLAIFLGSGLIPREIERRTIFMVVSKPIGRSAFIVGRLLGNVVTVFFVMALMTVLFFGQVVVAGATVHASQVVAVAGMALQVVLLTAITFFFASFSSQYVTAIASTGLFFLGHLAPDAYQMASRSKSEVVAAVLKGVYYLMPNFDRLDFKARATYQEATSLAEFGGSTAYALAYSVALVAIACVLFERRDFK
jgi:ABC-type transport system involved in multi-copper enzyme maturation permease subunit